MPKKITLAHYDLTPLYYYRGNGYLLKFYCPYCSEYNEKPVWDKKKGKEYIQCCDCGQEILVEWEDR